METLNQLQDKILQTKLEDFPTIALEIYEYQAIHNPLYAKFLQLIHKDKFKPASIYEIPFLPIEIFKHHAVKTGAWKEDYIFESSGTAGQLRSSHYVYSLEWYHAMIRRCFEYNYGKIDNYKFIGLLPVLQHNSHSSLLTMFKYLSKHNNANHDTLFPVDNFELLHELLQDCMASNQKIILFGLSFALLDYAKEFQETCENLIVIETGGMKNQKREMLKQDIIDELKLAFPKAAVHSEYGMTEMMSQAYASDGIHFRPSPWLNFLISDPLNPHSILPKGARGIINLIDLGNLHTCSFIQTGDLGIINENGQLEVLGRYSSEDVRGCVQLYEN